jgi:RNA polymerase sigma-70 factor (ECF subfamily)
VVDEAVIVATVRAGDANAFAVVVDRYQDRISRYLQRLVGHRQVAEDLTQETFVSAYLAIRRSDADLALSPWLYRIATNHANMYFRRRKLHQLIPFLGLTTAPPADVQVVEQDAIRRLLDRLPPTVAACLLLHMVEGFKYHEVGAIVGISAEAARKRVARGSELFRQAYAQEGVDL